MHWGAVSTCQVAAGWRTVRVDLCDWDNGVFSMLKMITRLVDACSDGWAIALSFLAGFLTKRAKYKCALTVVMSISDVRSTNIDSA